MWNNEFSFEGVDAAKNELVVKVGETASYVRLFCLQVCLQVHPVAPHYSLLPPLGQPTHKMPPARLTSCTAAGVREEHSVQRQLHRHRHSGPVAGKQQ